MKKICLLLVLSWCCCTLIVSTSSCKKEKPETPVAKSTAPLPTPPTELHFFYHWDYDSPTGVVHADSACITTDSMQTLYSTIHAYHINQGPGC